MSYPDEYYTTIGGRKVIRRNKLRGTNYICGFLGISAATFYKWRKDPDHWINSILRMEGQSLETTKSEVRAAAKHAGFKLRGD